MVMPKPRSGENQTDFITRCLSDKTMEKEYPDQRKRTSVCFTQWKDNKKGDENMKFEFDKNNCKRDEKGRIIVAENVPFVIKANIGIQNDNE